MVKNLLTSNWKVYLKKIRVKKIEQRILDAITQTKYESSSLVNNGADISNYTTVIDFPTFLLKFFSSWKEMTKLHLMIKNY